MGSSLPRHDAGVHLPHLRGLPQDKDQPQTQVREKERNLPKQRRSYFPSVFRRISLRREGAVSKEVLGDIAASGKKLSKQEKDERSAHSLSHTHTLTHTLTLTHTHTYRVSWKKNEVADMEATTFSIFYNNALFLFLVLAFLYFMRSFPPVVYPPSLPPSLSPSLPPSLSPSLPPSLTHNTHHTHATHGPTHTL